MSLRSTLALGLGLGLAASLAGCPNGDGGESCDDLGAPALQWGIGNLETGFQPIEPGDEVELELGPQGLHMYVIAVQVEGVDTSRGGNGLEAVDVAAYLGEDFVAGFHGKGRFQDATEGATELLGIRVVVDVEADYLYDEDLEFRVAVWDGCGRRLEDTRVLRSIRAR